MHDFFGRLWQFPLSLMLCVAPCNAELILSQGTNFNVDVSQIDGRLAMDLLGTIWIVPAVGGPAAIVSENSHHARRPRWSPDGARILYQTENPGTRQIWAVTVDDTKSSMLGAGTYFDQHPDWHPDGERIVFSSARGMSGFDIWETDIATGLSWRISSHNGDETEPAWSADGLSLVYVRRIGRKWSLILRRTGQPETELLSSAEPLSAPSWRPDGSLITFLRQTDSGLVIEMAILANPPLIRPFVAGEDFFVAPVSWLDKMQLYYTSDGVIKTRLFDDRHSTTITFGAAVGHADSRGLVDHQKKELTIVDPPRLRQVIRAGRILDSSGKHYRHDVDILIDGPRIAKLATRQAWPDTTILDLRDMTALPGFIDSYANVSPETLISHGAELLSYGVTTIVTSEGPPSFDPLLWESEQTPGPRLLRAGKLAQIKSDDDGHYQFVTISPSATADASQRLSVTEWQAKGVPVLAESWRIGLNVGADLLLGFDSLPASPKGYHYQDIQAAAAPAALVSGLADAGTPGLAALFLSRQAQTFQRRGSRRQRFSSILNLTVSATRFANSSPPIILGSKPSGLPPGLATHAEMRALAAAGLSAEQVLMTATANPARVLRLADQIGQIAEGALADMVLVRGDPLAEVSDAMNIVAVVRNGRFYSLVGLLERAGTAKYVE